jgi:hypothetical protein
MIQPSKGTSFLITMFLVTGACAQERTIEADIWVDNWHAVYLEDELLMEDSVPIEIEQSKNKDSFTFTAELPAQINIIARDFIENDSGLEYIGRARQQIGDGGLSAQFIDAESGEVLAATDETWHCLSIHRAPLNKSCERSADPLADCESEIMEAPEGWMSSDFDDSDWPTATVYTVRAVGANRGYNEVQWDSAAKLIWAADLEIDNTVLCRVELR